MALHSITCCVVAVVCIMIHASLLNSRIYKNLDRLCKTDEECHSTSVGIEKTSKEMACLNGYCSCKAPYQMHVEIMSPSNPIHDKFCTKVPKGFFIHGQNHFDSVCEKVDGKSYCRCKDHLILFTDIKDRRSYCGFSVISGFGKRCGQSNFFCNKDDRLECEFQKCFCKKNEMYNFTAGICQAKSDYMQLHNLSEYKVTHSVYCYKDSECIDGLHCSDKHKCSCPEHCIFSEEKDACDCGEVPVQYGPIIIGMFAGILIMFCWICAVSHVIYSHRKKRRELQMDDISSRPITEGGESVPVCIQTPPLNPAPTAPPLSPAPQSENHSSPHSSPTLTVRVDVDPSVHKPPSYSNLFDADPPTYEEATRESETALLKA